MKKFRKDFPIFKKEFDKRKIVYLDSAATTLKPKSVISRVMQFYEHETSNVSRGNHFLSEQNALAIEDVRAKTASFIKAQSHEIVFTQNCTDAINIVALSLNLKSDDEIIVSLLEHHSNYLPWIQKSKVKIVNIDKNGLIDLNHLESLISDKTKLLAITNASNITGNVQPVLDAIKIVKKKNILTLIDASQAASHFPIDVRGLDCDFLTFSSHKMFGPSGVGILYVKKEAQSLLSPVKFGGGMANKVSLELIDYKEFPHNFEAGTPNIEGILGLGAAIDYILGIGFPQIIDYLQGLEKYCKDALLNLDFINLFEIHPKDHLPIFTFFPKNKTVNIKDISLMLSDSFKIIVRGGFHCSQNLYNYSNIEGGIRASLHIYNTKKDVDKFIKALDGLRAFF